MGSLSHEYLYIGVCINYIYAISNKYVIYLYILSIYLLTVYIVNGIISDILSTI